MSDRYKLDTQLLCANVPIELRNGNRWIAWRYITREGQLVKMPVTGTSIDPTRWTSFDATVTTFQNDNKALDGIGRVFVREDGYVGVDFDRCVDAAGNITGLAAEWLPRLNSYTEVSPSGTGTKTWIRGKIPQAGRNNQKLGVEIY